jgi:hypothetical protein
MVEVFTGKKTRLSFKKESTYGTNPTGIDGWLGIVQKFDPSSDERTLLKITGLDSSTWNADDYINTVIKYGGTIDLWIQTCAPIAWVWGKDAVTGTEPYTHTISESSLSSMTIEVANEALTVANSHLEQYLGVMFSGAKIGWSAGNPVLMTMNWVAQDRTATDGSPTTYESTNTATKKYNASGSGSIAPFMYSDVDVQIEGVDMPRTISGSISIENNLGVDVVCDNDLGNKISEPYTQHREFTVELNGYVTTDSEYDSFLALYDGSALTGGTNSITFTRSASDKVVFTLDSNYTYVETFRKTHDVTADRVEYSMTIKTVNISPVATDSVSVNYITEV